MPDPVRPAKESDVLNLLTERAAWYREGCPHLEDRDGYFSSGDVARDAAMDLETALSEIRVLERTIELLREHNGGCKRD